MIIDYLLTLSKSLSNQSKWYSIATDIFTIYEKKILNHKHIFSSQSHPMSIKQDESQNNILDYKSSFSADEKELINLLFEACMEAKRYKVAKDLVKLSEENGFLIEDEKDYKVRLLKKKKMSERSSVNSVISHIIIFIFFAFIFFGLSFLELDEDTTNKLFVYSIITLTLIEVGLFFYQKKR
jgi:hypothetical protein